MRVGWRTGSIDFPPMEELGLEYSVFYVVRYGWGGWGEAQLTNLLEFFSEHKK